jgi:hypothetical protein
VENPNRHILRSALLVVFGMFLGLIPGAIKLDQMRRQVDAERADYQKLNAAATKQLAELRSAIDDEAQKHAADKADCQNAVLGDGARTILVDQNHPYGPPQQNFFGALVTIPGAEESAAARKLGVIAVGPGPIWVIPRAITPRVVDGVLGGAYTHVWPDGRSDGWKIPQRAE